MRLVLFVILFFGYTFDSYSQNVVNYCKGEVRNFAVPYTNGSVYNWYLENPNLATILSGNGTEHVTLNLSNSGIVHLTVEEININGCKSYDSITVIVNELPDVNIVALGPTSFCEGESVVIQLVEDYPFNIWNNGNVSNSIQVDSSGFYFITSTDNNGCTNISNSISVNVETIPFLDFSTIGNYCKNSSIQFINSSLINEGSFLDIVWNIDNNIINGDSIFYHFNSAGVHLVNLQLTTTAACNPSIEKEITIHENPNASFSYSPQSISISNPLVNFFNNSDNYVSSFWNFGNSITSTENNPNFIYPDPGNYDVTLSIIDENECEDSTFQNLNIYYDYYLYVPNTFTPNNDGENDFFTPLGTRMDKYINYQLYIYNRWGEKVFYTENIMDRWDGSNCQNGLYNWLLIITDELGKVRKETGEVMLTR